MIQSRIGCERTSAPRSRRFLKIGGEPWCQWHRESRRKLAQFLGRCRYDRGNEATPGYRHGHRERQLIGTFGTEMVSVPRARVAAENGKTKEWRSKALPRYQRLTKKAEA